MAAKRVVRREVWHCGNCRSWWPDRLWPLAYYLTAEAVERDEWPICPRCPDDVYPLEPIVLTRRRGVQSPHLRGYRYHREDYGGLTLLRRGEPLDRWPT